ncbi:MAG: hypothetical protein ACK4MT_02295 [Thermaurantiacus tibetensis]|uniref:hypothetical protein n=1 Tax=Thermaurantiacus tibetensis TaxID=2759035 RepID=UPI00188F863E|nr:hypothetical protein [Thermaurantiacus tibetensis]
MSGTGRLLAPGDILVAASDIDDTRVDLRNHRGPGRLLHFSRDFSLRGELRTGVDGLVVGLAIAPDGVIWTADPTGRAVVRFGVDGRRLEPISDLPERPWGSVLCLPDGTVLLAVHSSRGAPPEDRLGDRLLLELRDLRPARAFRPQSDGGRSGWHAITSLAAVPDDTRLLHLAEGGRTVGVFDLARSVDLDPFLLFPESDPRRAYGVAWAGSGALLATGRSVLRLDPEGRILAEWQAGPPETGWTRVTPSADGETFFLNNFLAGIIERRSLANGRVLAVCDIGRRCVLCGVADVA